MVIAGIPEKIARADYVRLVESVGLDVADLVSLTFGHASIVAEVMARNDEGKRYLERDEPAVHRISIPVEG